MRIAIHQPNFCPVKGYFDKISAVDLFVIMVHCQWEKGKYQNRFHVGDQWNTMSVSHGLEPINRKRYVKSYDDWDRIVKRYSQLRLFNRFIGESLVNTNVGIILMTLETLSIRTKITLDYKTNLLGSERLVDICKKHGATEYLSGKSGRKYLDLKQFDDAGIKVSFQDQPDLTPLVNFI